MHLSKIEKRIRAGDASEHPADMPCATMPPSGCFFPIDLEGLGRGARCGPRGTPARGSSPIPFAIGIGDRPLGTMSLSTGDRLAYCAMVNTGRRALLIDMAPARSTPMDVDPAIAEPASRELVRRLARWTRLVQALHSRRRVLDSEKCDRLGAMALAARMEAWAAYLAIDRCYSAMMQVREAAIRPLSDVLNQVFDALDAFDATLQRCKSSPSFAATSSAAAHWRKVLACPWREMPPWWLDENAEDLRVQRDV